MIEVSHLTKYFAGKVAVDDLSFQVERGEVVGFLGPNGAGKTTTLRMLCGYLPPSAGTILVGGRDVALDHLEVRRRIGYLPENVPLYPEMRVDEYLRFRARLKGVPRRLLRRRVDEVKGLCGLAGEEGRAVIGRLSKGFRQRVGLADALVHDPDLLILDEPTIGLDPNQIRQVRALIRDLARLHTVLLSTHILPEVENTCNRVLILNSGRVVAADTSARLRERLRGGARIRVELHDPRREAAAELARTAGVKVLETEALPEDWRRFILTFEDGRDGRVELYRLAAGRNWPLRELRLEEHSLEDIFVRLTAGEEEAGS